MSEDNIIIIGAGVSGIAMGCQLQRTLGFTNFKIYEKGTNFGGTWYCNTYPGCGCDVPSHFYSFSFEKKPDWTQVFPLREEIMDYLVDVAKKYDLPAHTQFETELVSADWNSSTERWTCNFKDLKTGKTSTTTCKFLVLATGPISIPNKCPIPGIENFKGKSWHSATWNHDVSLKNKDVVVIGNGCSATQIIPVILPEVKSLAQFVRSTHWYFPRPNWQYSDRFKWVMRYVPGANSLHRYLWATYMEFRFHVFKTDSKIGKILRDSAAKIGRDHVIATAPAKYHEMLIPSFQVGAKRRVFDTDYLPTLHDPKMTLTNDPLVQIKEKTVLTKSGKEYPAEIIVLANGFQVHERLMPLIIKGKSGEEIRTRWKRQGGVRAYMGNMVADFPNMFMIVGPNTASGHFSIIYMAECNVNFAIRLMKPFLGKNIKGSIEVTEEAEKKDVDWVKSELKKCIWGNTGEGGWYVNKDTGHNGTVYPTFQNHYWLRTLRPNWSDFSMNGAKKSNLFGIGLILIVLALIGIVLSWVVGK